MDDNEVTQRIAPSEKIFNEAVTAAQNYQDIIDSSGRAMQAVGTQSEQLVEQVQALYNVMEQFQSYGGEITSLGASGALYLEAIEETAEVFTEHFRKLFDELKESQTEETDKVLKHKDEKDEQQEHREKVTTERRERNTERERLRRDRQNKDMNIEDIFSSAEKDIGAGTSLITSLQSGNISGAAGALKKLIPKLAPVAGGLSLLGAGAGLYSTAINAYQDTIDSSLQTTGEKDVSLGAKLKGQSLLGSFTTGLRKNEIEQIQKTLLEGNIDVKSEKFDEGYEFAIGARKDYGIDAATATELYLNTVGKGTMSIEELNHTMDSFQDVVKESNVNMNDVVKSFNNATKEFERMTGSSQLATQYATEAMSYFTEGEQGSFATGLVGKIDWQSDRVAQAYKRDYLAEGKDESQALVLSSWQAFSDRQLTSLRQNEPEFALMHLPLMDNDDRTFADYVNNEQWDELEYALNNLSTTWQSYDGLNYIRKALNNLGVSGEEPIDTPEQIVNYFKKFSKGLSNVEGGIEQQGIGKTAWEGMKKTGKTTVEEQAYADALTGGTVLSQRIDTGLGIRSAQASAKKINDIKDDRELFGIVHQASGINIDDTTGANLTDYEISLIANQIRQQAGNENAAQWGKKNSAQFQKLVNTGGAARKNEKVDVEVELKLVQGAEKILEKNMTSYRRQKGRDRGVNS